MAAKATSSLNTGTEASSVASSSAASVSAATSTPSNQTRRTATPPSRPLSRTSSASATARTPPLSPSSKSHAASTLVRSLSTSSATSASSAPGTPSGGVRRSSPLTGNNSHQRKLSLSSSLGPAMDTYPELAKCSREQLVEMVGRCKKDLSQAQDKVDGLEESNGKLFSEYDSLAKDFELAKTKIDELLNEEGRMEEELAGRIEVVDKLRSSVRELERDKRDAEKRYRDQGDSFDAERQSWFDQEQHYKLRISNLSTTKRKARPRQSEPARLHRDTDLESESELSETPSSRPSRRSSSPNGGLPRSSTASPSPSGPSPNELALQEQLATLTTAHSSLTSTLRTLQNELSELKRVYQDLQEENESYEILLGEKTLNGEVQGSEFFRRNSFWNEDMFAAPTAALAAVGEEGEPSGSGSDGEGSEEEEGDDEKEELDVEAVLLETQGTGTPNSGAVSAGTPSGKRKKLKKTSGGGGGLDLAAELEAAQWVNEDEEETPKKKKKKSRKQRLEASEAEDLRSEVKQLREANKALTLYVSKIVDRVCSQEGFEKVLAVDYRLATPKSGGVSPDPTSKLGYNAAQPPPTTFRNYSMSLKKDIPTPSTPITSPNSAPNSEERSAGRRILGWNSVSSIFTRQSQQNAQSSSTPTTAPRPFSLSSEGSARKLEVEEDEDDIRERERLRAELALHGLEDSGNSWGSRPNSRPGSHGTRSNGSPQSNLDHPISPVQGPMSPSQGSIFATPLPDDPTDLDALAQASPLAASQIRSIEKKEKEAKSELDQGRASGFTEPKPRRHRPGSMRSSISSSSRADSQVGLGISDTTGRMTPDGSPNLSSPATSSSPDPNSKGDQDGAESSPSWGKRLKRLSISAGWSPNPSS
ncbi:hypothetical protein T439DRAFT_384060 [Meredithblackwellia eburnea MCA 4105]